MIRFPFILRRKRPAQGLLTIYDYLKTQSPGTLSLLAQKRLFDERLFLVSYAGPAVARHDPADELLTFEDLRCLMAAPGAEKRAGRAEGAEP